MSDHRALHYVLFSVRVPKTMLECIALALFRRADFDQIDFGNGSSTMLSLCRDHSLQFSDELSADVASMR
jgi:hypothetical protein